MKVLDITKFYSPMGGGVRTYLDAKAKWLGRMAGVEHVVVVPGPRDAVEQWHESVVYRVSGPPVPASPGYHFLVRPGKVRSIIRAERPDVVEIGSPFLVPWITRWAVRESGTRLVGFYHSDLPGVYVDHGLARAPEEIRGAARAVMMRYVCLVYGPLALTIAATRHAANTLREAGVRRVATVPLGVDLDLFSPERRDAAWRDETGSGGNGPVAIYAGRLSRERGLDVVLDALPALHAATGLRLVVMGEGHLRPRLEAFARRFPRALRVTQFETDRERLARALASADLSINPFPHETFGLAALEAMASGTSVVGADSGGLRDLLDGTPGCARFIAGDAGDLVRVVREVLADGQSRGALRAYVAERYGWGRTFEGMLELYRGL